MPKWITRCSSLLSVVAAICVAGTASSDTTWQVEGLVRTENNTTTFSPALVALGIDVGAPISGQFTFYDAVPDLEPDPDRARYDFAILGGSLSVGDVEIEILPGGLTRGAIRVAENVGTHTTVDVITLTAGGSSSDLDILMTLLELVATDLSVIDGTSIPVVPPSLSDLATFDDLFPYPFLTSFGFGALEATGLVRAEITSLTAVPEPSTALLVALGLVMLGARRRAAGAS